MAQCPLYISRHPALVACSRATLSPSPQNLTSHKSQTNFNFSSAHSLTHPHTTYTHTQPFRQVIHSEKQSLRILEGPHCRTHSICYFCASSEQQLLALTLTPDLVVSSRCSEEHRVSAAVSLQRFVSTCKVLYVCPGYSAMY